FPDHRAGQLIVARDERRRLVPMDRFPFAPSLRGEPDSSAFQAGPDKNDTFAAVAAGRFQDYSARSPRQVGSQAQRRPSRRLLRRLVNEANLPLNGIELDDILIDVMPARHAIAFARR